MSSIEIVETDGMQSYNSCRILAESLNGRLPTIYEVREFISLNGNIPIFEHDMWWPVADDYNEWISVGNYSWKERLGKSHSIIAGAKCDWGKLSNFVSERRQIGIWKDVAEFKSAISNPIEDIDGSLTYDLCKSFATERQGRLPTVEEVRQHILSKGNQPLYEYDAWWPVCNDYNEWVSVGSYESSRRLGKTHTEVANCKPDWGLDFTTVPYRKHLMIIQIINPHIQGSKVPILILQTDGTLSYDTCTNFARHQHEARLPTITEVRHYLQEKGNRPLFNTDMWWPVWDDHNEWISVGNYDPSDRLGKTHSEVAHQKAPWGVTSVRVAERNAIAVIKISKVSSDEVNVPPIPQPSH